MAAFSDVGACCAEPTCRRHTFLPFTCNVCAGVFCEEHLHANQHACSAPPTTAAEPLQRLGQIRAALPEVKRCAAIGCREALAAHNTIRCWRCHRDVCIKHRFEDDHPCTSVQEAVAKALDIARDLIPPEEMIEAKQTLEKVFGNILKDPGNEKFRTLKKDNKIVKEKLRHPACVEALKLCGFSDMGETFVCRPTADLTLMRQMSAALKTHNPSAFSSSGTRLVNGVIVRQPREEVSSPSPAAAPKAKPGAASSGSSDVAGKPPPKTAFDFERRENRDQRTQSQQTALSDLRQLQKDKYKADTGGYPAGAPASGATAQTQAQGAVSAKARAQPQQQPQQQQEDQCTLQ